MTSVLPSQASVVLIGGGAKGCSPLYHLAKIGVSDAIQCSVELYARLKAEAAQNVGWIPKGSLPFAANADRLTHVKRQESLAQCIVHGRTADDPGDADTKRLAPVFKPIDHLMARALEIFGTHFKIAYPARQLKTARNLRALPLAQECQNAKAPFGQFYGWEHPLCFGTTA